MLGLIVFYAIGVAVSFPMAFHSCRKTYVVKPIRTSIGLSLTSWVYVILSFIEFVDNLMDDCT
ncbi:MAG: hypothetical protein J6Y37_15230 [Paludibacteraceae bacterium]|nr:hypothetical protein [Paludibacteraceae bacterium]